MSNEEDEKSIIEVGEDAWEEDSPKSARQSERESAEVSESFGDLASSEVSESAEGDATTSSSDSESPSDDDVPSSESIDAPLSIDDPLAEAPFDEELSESLRPMPPPVPSFRPSDPPADAVRSSVDAVPVGVVGFAPEPPPSDPPPAETPSGFSHPAVTEPSLSIGEQLLRARRTGTGIWFSGVILWAYLIVGEYVVGPGLPEELGFCVFVGIIVGAFLHGANRVGLPSMRKSAAIATVANVIGVLFLSSIVGSSSRSEYQGMSLLLLLVSVALIFYGIRFARGGLPGPVAAPGTRWGRVATWILFASNTGLIAIAFLAQIA